MPGFALKPMEEQCPVAGQLALHVWHYDKICCISIINFQKALYDALKQGRETQKENARIEREKERQIEIERQKEIEKSEEQVESEESEESESRKSVTQRPSTSLGQQIASTFAFLTGGGEKANSNSSSDSMRSAKSLGAKSARKSSTGSRRASIPYSSGKPSTSRRPSGAGETIEEEEESKEELSLWQRIFPEASNEDKSEDEEEETIADGEGSEKKRDKKKGRERSKRKERDKDKEKSRGKGKEKSKKDKKKKQEGEVTVQGSAAILILPGESKKKLLEAPKESVEMLKGKKNTARVSGEQEAPSCVSLP